VLGLKTRLHTSGYWLLFRTDWFENLLGEAMRATGIPEPMIDRANGIDLMRVPPTSKSAVCPAHNTAIVVRSAGSIKSKSVVVKTLVWEL
jgi:hypothetical protein